jgi:hypothetical protein
MLCAAGHINVLDFERNPLNIFASHETAGFIDGSMATKMTVQVFTLSTLYDHFDLTAVLV